MIAAMFSAGRRLTFSAGTLLFLSIGALVAMWGPAFLGFRERYGIGVDQVGNIVSAFFLGAFVTIALSGWLLPRFGYRRVLTGAALLLALGSLGVALSPSWWLAIVSALIGGLGFGAVDVGTNLLFTRVFEGNSAPALNMLNAMFSIGAVLGPLLIGRFDASITAPFAILAGVLLVSALLATRLPNPVPRQPVSGVRIPVVAVSGFMMLYFVYVVAEVGVANWEATYLAPYVGAATAAGFTSLFWAAMALGRLVAAPISARIAPGPLVLGASLLALIGMLAASNVALAPWAYALVGFAHAPIFPTALAWLHRVLPERAERVTPWVFATANLGPVLSAPLIAAAVAGSSSDAIPLILSAIGALLVLVTASLWWRTRGA